MTNTDIFKDISGRTNGAIMIGVVGPVRTGKSTFIKQFMETLVIPNIDDIYMRERAKDELPQSGSGRTIMTSEPKFVPEEAVNIRLSDDTGFSVRLVDCVGYMVKGASGQFEDGNERLVTTPWFDHEVSMTEAAETGTYKVITEHSTIGLVITTDGTICDIPREDYVEPEERVINELKAIGKPFTVILNSAYPESESAISLAEELSEKYSVPCTCLNCQRLTESSITDVMGTVLGEFPAAELALWLPSWFESMDDDCELKKQLYEEILNASQNISKMRDISAMADAVGESELVERAFIENTDMGSGTVNVRINMPQELYYRLLSEETGIEIRNEGELMNVLRELSAVKKDYDTIESALNDVRTKGYGVVMPTQAELQLEEPKMVKQGGKYSVKLKAKAPAIHMLKTGVETVVSPAIGGENASEEIISFLLQGYEGDMSRLWESNIFGRSLYDIAEEGITAKLSNIPENARAKLQETLQRIINEGNGTLICILL